mgnify:FL=1
MYRIDDFSSPIGQYALYAEAENLTFTSDSRYLVLNLADTRILFLLLCDPKLSGHVERVKVSRQIDSLFLYLIQS